MLTLNKERNRYQNTKYGPQRNKCTTEYVCTEYVLIVDPWESGSSKIKLGPGSGSVSACCGFCGGP